ncbi:2-aminoethylphosphonate ABC transporter substrate-binding protein [Carnimonas nigrificans]|uniref:2-aminoethylphosphonate ABC transporter substrate-binding protein n=1 Tax=Carnimonas nigrificans TaxID=64323 RepID=UPI00046FEC8E|nr:2-aminoethylphosphonate ABC transporter substrate-binding protein [Carnimonas nigrificans]
MKLFHLALWSALTLTSAPSWAEQVVTVYSIDGLHNGNNSWYQTQFEEFTKATGISVRYVEAGGGVVVERLAKERSNPQADVLVSAPPFIQRAASEKLLESFKTDAAAEIPDSNDLYSPLVKNYLSFIYNSKLLKTPPVNWTDLLDSKFQSKLQYSTPGQAADGTGVMLQVFHSFGSKEAGLDYLSKLQANNVGPSSSTGKLTGLVNKGEIYVANGDLQMNLAQMEDNPNVQIFWPADKDGKRSALEIPYTIGLVKGAPDSENGKKLINFLQSKEAQASVSALSFGMPVRSDVTPTDDHYKAAVSAMEGVESWQPDWNEVAASLSEDISRWNEMADGE